MYRKLFLLLGVLSLLMCVGTWVLDLTGLVEECIYCRTQRTVIGLLGILMLLPTVKYLFSYLAFVLGFYGAHVSSAQIFMNIRHDHFAMFFILATCALFWIILQVCVIHWYCDHYLKNRLPRDKS